MAELFSRGEVRLSTGLLALSSAAFLGSWLPIISWTSPSEDTPLIQPQS
eukprot:CAMPEP_0181474042 /NCGR_PEP_ID=MMETSP1110-20121109/40437_1 /TAXON_ID=174948 /ORGANISM="Symbiodinium sp., Strain CCMP421" /LENGTH=48 /DNA_ID= /DNA_START= /DNA_END= /DNA_ORIENTATION=